MTEEEFPFKAGDVVWFVTGSERCFDVARAADDGFRIPAAVANAMLDGEQPVKAWREHRGLTQEALAEKAQISKAYLCQIETRKRVGALKTLRAVADALSISLNELHED